MLLDSKGKLFGKVSIIDVIVILLVIFAIVGAYFRFHGSNTSVVVNNQDFYYVISINNIRETNKDSVLQSIGTQFRLSGKISSTMGELVDVQVFDAKGTIDKSDGTIVSATVPERYDLKLKFKVNGNVNDYGYFTPETYEVCAGKEYNITNINCCLTGTVDKVWTE